ncbi:Gaa1-domain-containing protein [Auricularia subglabra TFB-10046 SS5]|nr:Gaa1-domain-containing protein [Auricularia subglabra TFB-10046 SS5]
MTGLLYNLIVRKLKRGGKVEDDPNAASLAQLHRSKRLQYGALKSLPYLRCMLLVIGYTWLLVLPWPRLGRGTYADEHAMQPGLVNTNWGWSDVHAADRYLDQLTTLRARKATKDELALWVKNEFTAVGLAAATQRYTFTTNDQVVNGTNAYAVFRAPRASGAEAIVISTSWLSLVDGGHGSINERGIPTVLALSRFLTKYCYWAKDLVFVVSDGYLDGMQAWLSSYHGTSQSNLRAEPLEHSSGVIWTAVNIDYPGHSFSHIGLFYEGLNGRLPNLDLMNTTHRGGVSLVLHDDAELPLSPPAQYGQHDWGILLAKDIGAYLQRAKHILRYFSYHVVGRPSGVHGLFHQYRIDAMTLYAVPAAGPHGFHSLGRLIESSLRSMNNLLERLHASFFFYLMTGPTSFLTVGLYLPSAIILGIAITVTGLGIWHGAEISDVDSPDSEAEWQKQVDKVTALQGAKKQEDKPRKVAMVAFRPTQRRRPVIEPLLLMLLTHLLGALLLVSLRFDWLQRAFRFSFPFIVVTYAGLIFTSTPRQHLRNVPKGEVPLHLILRSFTLLFCGMVITITAVLNFALAASLGAILAMPLVCVGPRSHRLAKLLLLIPAVALLGSPTTIESIVREWYILGGWFLPFACLVYVPIVLQTWVVALL